MTDKETILISAFVAVEGAHSFSAFMPSYFTVKKFSENHEDLKKLRSGYAPAIAFNLTLGLIISILVKNELPFILSVLVVAFMVTLYERAIPNETEETGS